MMIRIREYTAGSIFGTTEKNVFKCIERAVRKNSQNSRSRLQKVILALKKSTLITDEGVDYAKAERKRCVHAISKTAVYPCLAQILISTVLQHTRRKTGFLDQSV